MKIVSFLISYKNKFIHIYQLREPFKGFDRINSNPNLKPLLTEGSVLDFEIVATTIKAQVIKHFIFILKSYSYWWFFDPLQEGV